MYEPIWRVYREISAAKGCRVTRRKHFAVSGGSSPLKEQRNEKHLTNDCRWAFLLLASTIYNAYYYECECWCQFGKEFSSDNAGDGPVNELLNLRDDWALGYESPPPSQLFIKRALSRYIFTTDVLQSIHPLDWLSCFFAVARMRIACRRRAEHHDIQRKKITRTWKYIFHSKMIPPSLEDQVYSLVENNLNESFAAMALSFGCDPLPPVCLWQPDQAKSEDCFVPVESQPPDKCEETLPSEKEHRVKQKTPRTIPRKKCRVKKVRKQNHRKSSKKSARVFKQSFIIISNPDWKGYDTHGILGNVSHPEGETQSCDYDRD